jgi:hypothetical protein
MILQGFLRTFFISKGCCRASSSFQTHLLFYKSQIDMFKQFIKYRRLSKKIIYTMILVHVMVFIKI